MGKRILSTLCISILSVSVSCQKSDDSNPGIGKEIPILTRATKETYLSGKKFCEDYVNTGTKETFEIGKYVEVPKDYSGDSTEKIKLYTFMKKEFNPDLPTFIFVDGGPGQNSHGAKDFFEDGTFNQIYFDQRGLGCSAAETWEEYRDKNLYSSENTTRDIDEIRKNYGIQKISVYGVSYGTVPASLYGDLFKKNVGTIVLEGIVGDIGNTLNSKAPLLKKWNLMISALNPKQKESFDKLMLTDADSEKSEALVSLFFMSKYMDNGYKIITEKVLKKLINEDGTFSEENFKKIKKSVREMNGGKYRNPQQPGAVDLNILDIIYCKNLSGLQKPEVSKTVIYSEKNGFEEKSRFNSSTTDESCEKWDIKNDDVKIYSEKKISINAPVYYFQGSHDGATYSTGAFSHWNYVPSGKSFFLLAKKAGHNPGLVKLNSDNKDIAKAQAQLYRMAFKGEEIADKDLVSINQLVQSSGSERYQDRNIWMLLTKTGKNVKLQESKKVVEEESEGIKKLN